MSAPNDDERILLRQSMHDVSGAADILYLLVDKCREGPPGYDMTGPLHVLAHFLADVSCEIGNIAHPPA